MPSTKPINIEDIEVYDPKKDGLDFDTYSKAYWAAHAINIHAAYAMHDGIMDKVSGSKVLEDDTLDDFLFNDEVPLGFAKGFFNCNPDIVAVLFMDGKFHSKYTREEYKDVDIDKIAAEANSIPFMFSYFPEISDYLDKQEAIRKLVEENS